MICPGCGLENRPGAQFCHHCGAALPTAQPPAPATRPLPAANESPGTVPLASGRRSGDTQPLDSLKVSFVALPRGALLNQGRYEVLEVQQQAAQQNIYLVQDSHPVRSCPNCHRLSEQQDDLFCGDCGASLASVPELRLRLRVIENANPAAYSTAEKLLTLGLQHPALALPWQVFLETPYATSARSYLVLDEFASPLASTLRLPQDPAQVLAWGVTLAQGLDYLHQHEVTFSNLSLTSIAVNDKGACWAGWQTAYFVPTEQREQAQGLFAKDIQNLASILVYLISGQQQLSAVNVPENARAILAQASQSPSSVSAAMLAAGLEQALQGSGGPREFVLRVGYRTDVGSERALNEDSLSTLTLVQSLGSMGVPVGIYVVADGMGGHDAGELASQITVKTVIHKSLEQLLPAFAGASSLPDGQLWLRTSIAEANQRVHEQRKVAGTDMGCTCVAALLSGHQAILGNVGDSRAYLLTAAAIQQQTVDHSLVERLVAAGQITREEAEHHPQKNVIYRVIGDKAQIEVDLFEAQLGIGEAILLCSDGLSGMISDNEIWQIWRTSTSPQEACDRLVEAANSAGGLDNISVIVIQLTH